MSSKINYKRVWSTSDAGLTFRVSTLENNEYKITYFESVSAATGTITKPAQSTILLDQFFSGIDAYVSTIVNGQPTGILPQTSGGTPVDVSSFDALGNYTLTGTPSAFPVAIIYVLKIKAIYYSNLNIDNILDLEDFNAGGGGISGLTTNELVYGNSATSIASLPVATYPSLTELSYVKGVTQSIQPLLTDTRIRKVSVQSNTDASTTSTTVETVLKTLLIPTLGANTTLKIMSHCGKVGTAVNAVFKMYYNTTPDLSGSPVQIALSNFIAASQFAPFNRDITNKNSVTSNSVFPATASAATEILSSVARTNLDVDLSGQYIVITGKAGSALDSVRVDNARLLIEE